MSVLSFWTTEKSLWTAIRSYGRRLVFRLSLLRRFLEDRLINRHIVLDLLKGEDEGLIGHRLGRLKRDLHTVYRAPVAEVNFGAHQTTRRLTCHIPANQ